MSTLQHAFSVLAKEGLIMVRQGALPSWLVILPTTASRGGGCGGRAWATTARCPGAGLIPAGR